ncbi:putative F-box protein At3g16210 [Cicer arietinum]|uniref:F-box protein At3g16210 n=1 Tax=Cicer arietinum TaxID=3827 RepID=A0A1S2XI37_CICAR|nr:putative F-box protein At3g16210 [Cicer arietinum]
MEKFVVTTNVKVNNHIPNDLVLSILSKLPIKSLNRFACVCKSWTLLFKIPHFLIMYHNYFLSNNHSYYDGTSILLNDSLVHLTNELDEPLHSTLYLLSGDRLENRIKLDWPPPFHEDDSCIHILSYVAVNGTLCFTHDIGMYAKCVFWNPATDKFKVIPPNPFEFVPYHNTLLQPRGFGYDHERDDYKVIRQLVFFVDDNIDVPCEEPIYFSPMWEIYSIRSNSWRKLDVDMPYSSACDELYMDGVYHWWSINDYSSLSNVGPCLVSFDLCNEVFLTTPFP